jgi:hypothetical protein
MTVFATCDGCGEGRKCIQTHEGLICEDCEEQHGRELELEDTD